MDYFVWFTNAVRDDLRELHAFISEHDSLGSADHVAREIVRATLTLREFPGRGTHPPELLRKGSRSYRQIFFKLYRIFSESAVILSISP